MNAIEILINLSGKSQKEFAEAVGIPAPNLSEMKHGKRDISLGKFLEWCTIFKIKPENIFKLLSTT